jgi:predicted Zn-dependent protease
MKLETSAPSELGLDLDRAREIFADVKRASAADETELMLTANISELTRFANNIIHQNVAEQRVAVSVRTVIGGRMARATTNRLDRDSIRAVVERASELTRLQQPDPETLPMPGPQQYQPVSRFYDATAQITPDDRARAVAEMVHVATSEGLTTAGTFSTGQSAFAMLNSAGLEAFYQDTGAEYSVTMLGGNSSGWAKGNSPDVARLDPAGGARIAAEKARLSADPIEIPPGKYTVVLEPAAMLDLLGFVFWDFGGLSVIDQRSFLTGRVGQKLFAANITVFDDVYDELQSGPMFDGEGVPRLRIQLIRDGVVDHLVYARQTAARMHKQHPEITAQPTGHGFPLPNEFGEMPMNIVMQGGSASVEEMVRGTDRGILITRLWYIREVDPYEKILTGMTRDGTFLIENGKVTRGVRNLRFNQSMIELLNNIEVLGKPVRASGEESFDMVVPAVRARNFNFTEVTRF